MAHYRRKYRKAIKEVDLWMQSDDVSQTLQEYHRLPVDDDVYAVCEEDSSQLLIDGECFNSN